jgi:hypothetical protein
LFSDDLDNPYHINNAKLYNNVNLYNNGSATATINANDDDYPQIIDVDDL